MHLKRHCDLPQAEKQSPIGRAAMQVLSPALRLV